MESAAVLETDAVVLISQNQGQLFQDFAYWLLAGVVFEVKGTEILSNVGIKGLIRASMCSPAKDNSSMRRRCLTWITGKFIVS